MFRKLTAIVLVVFALVSCSKDQQVFNPQIGGEVISKGVEEGPKPVLTCSNVIQFDLRQGKREAIPTIYTIKMDYTIKACTAGQDLGAAIDVIDIKTGELVYSAADLPLSGKHTFYGVVFGLYKAVIKVIDIKTGAIIETKATSIKVASLGV